MRGTDIRFATGSAERGRFTDNGLTFNGDTAAANALDDYEEGTFTPQFTQGVSVTQYSNQTGFYTKIGNLVTVSIYLRAHTASTDGNIVLVGTLPFVCANTSGMEGGGSLKYTNGFFGTDPTNEHFHPLPWISINTSVGKFHAQGDGNSIVGTDCTPGGKYLIFDLQYFVA